MRASHWMSWEGGFDLVAMSAPGLAMPDVIVHVARMVHTPVGSAPAGMVLVPGAKGGVVMGFVCPDDRVGKYFGPTLFAGTPFEQAPVLHGSILIESGELPSRVSATVHVGGTTIAGTMTGLTPMELFDRAPAAMPPFAQRVLECVAGGATLSVDAKAIPLTIPAIGITGGPAATWSVAGVYAR